MASERRGQSLSSFDPDEAPRAPRKLWVSAPETPRDKARAEHASGFRTGQKVRHAVFGVGVVLNVTGAGDDTTVEAVFPKIGPKKLMLAYARLEHVS